MMITQGPRSRKESESFKQYKSRLASEKKTLKRYLGHGRLVWLSKSISTRKVDGVDVTFASKGKTFRGVARDLQPL